MPASIPQVGVRVVSRRLESGVHIYDIWHTPMTSAPSDGAPTYEGLSGSGAFHILTGILPRGTVLTTMHTVNEECDAPLQRRRGDCSDYDCSRCRPG